MVKVSWFQTLWRNGMIWGFSPYFWVDTQIHRTWDFPRLKHQKKPPTGIPFGSHQLPPSTGIPSSGASTFGSRPGGESGRVDLFFRFPFGGLWSSLMLTAPFCSRGFGVGFSLVPKHRTSQGIWSTRDCWWQPEIRREFSSVWMVLKPVVHHGLSNYHINWWTPDFFHGLWYEHNIWGWGYQSPDVQHMADFKHKRLALEPRDEAFMVRTWEVGDVPR